MALSNGPSSELVDQFRRTLDNFNSLASQQCEILSRCEANRQRLVTSIEQAERFDNTWRGDLFDTFILTETPVLPNSPGGILGQVTAQEAACNAIEGARQNRNVWVGFDDLSDGVNPQNSMNYATFCEVGRLMNGKITRYEIQNQEDSSVDRPPRLVATTDYFNEIFSRDPYPIHLSQKKFRFNVDGFSFDWFIVYDAHKTCIPQSEYFSFLRQQAAVFMAYANLLISMGLIESESELGPSFENLKKMVNNSNAEAACVSR